MGRPVLTQEQITTLLTEYGRRLIRLEHQMRAVIENSLSWSGSASSGATSNTGGFGSESASFSGDLSSSLPDRVMTSGTGSDSISLPERK